MYSAEQLVIQALIYAVVFAMYAGAVVVIVRTRFISHQWIAIFFCLGFLENIVAFPFALFGYQRYAWLLGHPDTTRYLMIVLVGMSSAAAACVIFARTLSLPRLLQNVPPLSIDERTMFRVALTLSAFGAIVSIILSLTGYRGYFMDLEFTHEPPMWFGPVRAALNLCLGLTFVVFFAMFSTFGRMRPVGWLLIAGWAIAGLLAGYKSLLVLPFFFLVFTSWITRRFRMAFVALLVGSIFLAYGLIQPMRELNQEAGYTALQSLSAVLTGSGSASTDERGVAERFVNRVDHTTTAVQALEADRYERLNRFRARVAETYRLLPMLAFIPAALWPEKPLADLGRDLSIALTGNEFNSITPSVVVASYLWLGYPGVILNSILAYFFLALAGRLLERYRERPLAYFPVVLLILPLSIQETLTSHHYIGILRALVLIALFYVLAPALGLTARRRASPVGNPRHSRAPGAR